MNPLLSPGCVILVLLLASCATSPSSSSRHESYVKPGLILLTADQAEQRGINVQPPTPATASAPADLEPLDASAVVSSPGVKVYTLNRQVDPADRELLHEQHVVYRRETGPEWTLQAPSNRKILVGPTITDGRQELRPLLDKELTAFLSDQRRVTESNQKAIAALFDAVASLNRQNQALIQELGKARNAAVPDAGGAAAMPPRGEKGGEPAGATVPASPAE